MGGHYQESHAEIETPEVPFEHKVLRSCRDYPDRLIGQYVFLLKSTRSIALNGTRMKAGSKTHGKFYK